MLKNYLKTALRNLGKHKAFSFINLSGLMIGIACCILILLYVRDELSYDRYHEHAGRIWRVTREWLNEDGTTSLHLGHVAPPIAPLLKNDFPDIIEAVRIQKPGRLLCSFDNRHFLEEDMIFADENLFKVFSFTLVKGDPETALKDPFSIVITERAARKYFGDQDPIDKVLKIENRFDARISGVVRAAPANSHFHFVMIGSLNTIKQLYGQREFQSWSSNNYATYLLLPPDYPADNLRSQFPAFLDRHLGESSHERNRLHLQHLTDIHLHSHLDSELEPNSSIVNVYIFSAIAVFVLLIACINFMNLSTARSSVRAKEVGMRKVVGAQRGHLIQQFLSESLLMAFLALALAVILVKIALPAFSGFVNRELKLGFFDSWQVWLGLFIMALLVGVAAGSYPAFFLSSFRPALVLKGTQGPSGHGSRFRTILVVAQFAISTILIISVTVVYKQLQFSRSKRLGFNQEQIVVLPTSSQIRSQYETIRTRLLAHPGIVNVAASRRVPSGRLLDSGGARLISGTSSEPINFRIAFVTTSYDFIPTYEMELVAGRDFSREFSTDTSQAFILNETAVRKIGWSPEEAINQDFQYGRRKGRIIGIVKDFHFESLHQEISPMVFYIERGDYRRISVRLSPENIPQTMAFLQKEWRQYRPNYPFDYFFIDENFDDLYRSEEKLGQVFGAFALLAIFIACLGLFGLASFTAEKRTKEIGIRKVLGAPVSGIIFLLSQQFAKWVFVANAIAWPLAYFAMQRWLQNFAYRTQLGLWIFLGAAGVSLIITLLTVSFQSVKAALADPVNSLRYE